jgi:hypothetical protein
MRWPCRWPTARHPDAFAGVGELQWHIQLSIVQFAARKRRQKHRWRESNPLGAGLESGLLPKLTDDDREKERAASVGFSRLRRLLMILVEITQAGRPHSGSAGHRAHRRGCSRIRAGIAGTLTRRRRLGATPALRSACRTRWSPWSVVLAGNSFTRNARLSQCISQTFYSLGISPGERVLRRGCCDGGSRIVGAVCRCSTQYRSRGPGVRRWTSARPTKSPAPTP